MTDRSTDAARGGPIPSAGPDEPRPRPRVSAIITCVQAERHIAACIESLLWCDEILVVDSMSTDRTREIAASYDKVRVETRRYRGAAAQKNWAIEQVKHDWILIFDVDERCRPELRDEIETLLADGPRDDAYTIRRRVYILGHRIRYSGWQNDSVVRLFRCGAGYYENRRVHARLVTRGAAPVLRASMDHFMVDSFHEYVQRITKYGYWGAAQLWRDGKRSGFGPIAVRPAYRFLRTYLLQLGILDGLPGLAFCLLQSYGTYVKWAVLWGWQVNAARGLEPNLPEFDDDSGTWQGLDRVASGP